MTTSKLKTLKPINASSRGTVLLQNKSINNIKPHKKLVEGLKKNGGRDNHGHISTRHKGGGAKRLYRIINFKKKFFDKLGTVKTIEYDPNRNALISLIEYEGGGVEYMISANGLNVGDTVIYGPSAEYKIGNSMPLKKIPVGVNVYNVELRPMSEAKIVRSAGTSAKVVSRDLDKVKLQLPSGEIKDLNPECYATIGTVSNPLYKNIQIGKAGRNRWLGKRPSVRGVAMNPVDHPHGGGEGKTAAGRHPVTPWGKKTKGLKTRKTKRKFY